MLLSTTMTRNLDFDTLPKNREIKSSSIEWKSTLMKY